MITVEVAASRKYNVNIGRGLIVNAGGCARSAAPGATRAAVITDSNVGPLYVPAVRSSLAAAGLETEVFTLPSGETSKNGESYLAILNFLARGHFTRSDVLVALGGGMVGDITGFAAATYLRGVALIQMPTSLLAMVDSSVGGKTAIDLDAGKNLAGAFYQPGGVLCDCDTLSTLPEDIFADGCAEVLKYGVLGDRGLFEHLLEKGRGFDTEYVVGACVSMKRDYVCADEFDNGERRKLNLGHTLGHAVEKCSGYAVSHGRAVAIGLACVARASAAASLCTKETAAQITAALEALGLPVRTEYSMEELYEPMLSDKKRAGGVVNLIVPRRIGSCAVYPVDIAALGEFMKAGL